MTTTMLPIEQLHPNDYTPNRMAEVPVIEADDREAMIQAHKRNQHGTVNHLDHFPVETVPSVRRAARPAEQAAKVRPALGTSELCGRGVCQTFFAQKGDPPACGVIRSIGAPHENFFFSAGPMQLFPPAANVADAGRHNARHGGGA